MLKLYLIVAATDGIAMNKLQIREKINFIELVFGKDNTEKWSSHLQKDLSTSNSIRPDFHLE